jgi:molybdopterin converting factor small subunit
MLERSTYILKQLKTIEKNEDIVLDKNTLMNMMEDLIDWYKKEKISEEMFKSIKVVLENYNNLYCNN